TPPRGASSCAAWRPQDSWSPPVPRTAGSPTPTIPASCCPSPRRPPIGASPATPSPRSAACSASTCGAEHGSGACGISPALLRAQDAVRGVPERAQQAQQPVEGEGAGDRPPHLHVVADLWGGARAGGRVGELADRGDVGP